MIHYAVTQGCYSDYHIITICSTREEAERVAKIFYDAEVEEYDDGQVNEGVWFKVSIIDNWEVEPLSGKSYSYIEEPRIDDNVQYLLRDDTHIVCIEYNTLRIYVKTFSEDIARKSAQDLYAALKALANGV